MSCIVDHNEISLFNDIVKQKSLDFVNDRTVCSFTVTGVPDLRAWYPAGNLAQYQHRLLDGGRSILIDCDDEGEESRCLRSEN